MLGRQAECALIDELLEQARGGSGRSLLLRGEPGVGKTELLNYAASKTQGMRVLRARGVESEAGLPFAGLADLFRPVVSLIEALPPPQRAALAGALALGPPVEGDRFTVCAATLSLLDAAAEEAPVLALMDDAHWLDPSSGEALLFAARRLEAEGVLLVLAARAGEGRILEGAGLEELRLAGLDIDASRQLLTREAETEIRPRLMERLHEATGGNPLALTEIGTLLRRGEISEARLVEGALPDLRIDEAFRRHAARLPDHVRDLLLVAAATRSGDARTIEGACRLLGLKPSFERVAAEELIALREGIVEFRHPLIRHAIYKGATVERRREAHRAVAAVLPADSPLEDRAWHLAAATSGPDEEVARALVESAGRARERGAHPDAAAALSRAAEFTGDGTERARLLLEAAQEWEIAGSPKEASAAAEAALPLAGDRLLRADIQHLRGRGEMWRGRLGSAHSLLVSEARKVEADSPRRAGHMLLDAANVALMVGNVAAAFPTAEQAHTVAARGDRVMRVAAGALLGFTRLLLDADRKRTRHLFQEADKLIAELDSPIQAFQLFPYYGFAAVWMEEYESAKAFLDPIIHLARAASAPAILPIPLICRALLDFTLGAWPEATAKGYEAVRLADETGQPNAAGYTLCHLAAFEAVHGREKACREHAGRGLVLAERFGSPAMECWARAALSLLEVSMGRIETAVTSLEAVDRICVEMSVRNPCIPWFQGDLIETYIRAGRRDDADQVLARFTAGADRMESRMAWAGAARCRGLMADDNRFDPPFEEALSWHENLPVPFERARTELCYGERLRRVKRLGEARTRLDSAMETFERLGAAPWMERARRELEAAGRSVRRREYARSRDLTPQELQVAQVVAQGATNREAAQSLFLSPKTIEAHLHRAYVKLGLRSRTELAALLVREGMFPLADPGMGTEPSESA